MTTDEPRDDEDRVDAFINEAAGALGFLSDRHGFDPPTTEFDRLAATVTVAFTKGGVAIEAIHDLREGDVEVNESPRVLRRLWRALHGDDVDGIAANDELALGASPFRIDSDRDGVADDVELGDQSALDDADTDGDGFSDAEEKAAGTDPRKGVVYRHGDPLGSTVLMTPSDPPKQGVFGGQDWPPGLAVPVVPKSRPALRRISTFSDALSSGTRRPHRGTMSAVHRGLRLGLRIRRGCCRGAGDAMHRARRR